ncbi:hypothetical protein D3C86_1651710 [compost metagenome]
MRVILVGRYADGIGCAIFQYPLSNYPCFTAFQGGFVQSVYIGIILTGRQNLVPELEVEQERKAEIFKLEGIAQSAIIFRKGTAHRLEITPHRNSGVVDDDIALCIPFVIVSHYLGNRVACNHCCICI